MADPFYVQVRRLRPGTAAWHHRTYAIVVLEVSMDFGLRNSKLIWRRNPDEVVVLMGAHNKVGLWRIV